MASLPFLIWQDYDNVCRMFLWKAFVEEKRETREQQTQVLRLMDGSTVSAGVSYGRGVTMRTVGKE